MKRTINYNAEYKIADQPDDLDEIITRKKVVQILFDYPFGGPFENGGTVSMFKVPNLKGLTKGGLLEMVRVGYQHLYSKYNDEIWGHSINDLVLEGAYIRKDGVITLSIGS